jgi:PPP family 3-phenylpropionic acid transporter
LVTLVSGQLYASMGAQGFWVMAVLCIAALPLALSLRRTPVNTGTPQYSAAETH